ncbi:UDP-glucosyltransferase 2 [Procambarus clarkii]|uniref:UDP-glucosyltransferase 2 n=1 Tax=Procambarus clarkii TaxID=6728 RepID=UPI003741F942
MKLPILCLLAVAAGGAGGVLTPPHRSYRILMLLPIASISHRNVFMPLATALADRGHQVVMLTSNQELVDYPNIQEIYHGIPIESMFNRSLFEDRNDPIGIFLLLGEILLTVVKRIYQVPVVKDLYHRRKEFDLVIINQRYNEIVYPFLHEIPFITLSTRDMDLCQSAILGNVLNPAYFVKLYSNYFDRARGRLTLLVQRLRLDFYWRYWQVIPKLQKEISAQFPGLPPLLELERNVSLVLANTHFSMGPVLPLLPSQVDVGGMHCRPGHSLPRELDSWISGAGSAGVVYFSLGSVFKTDTLPDQYVGLFVEVFRRLPQRVIWKYDGRLEGLSDNVLVRKWLPQQDILAQDSVKAFITHGGLLSLQEAVYHAKPVLVLPLFSDQPRNAKFVWDKGLGLTLSWNDALTPDKVVGALTDVITNPKYKENVTKISHSLRDQMLTPRELAVFWTEYVLRHPGVPHLRNPAAHLSWLEFLMLDVLLVVLLALLVFCFILRSILRTILGQLVSLGAGKIKTE